MLTPPGAASNSWLAITPGDRGVAAISTARNLDPYLPSTEPNGKAVRMTPTCDYCGTSLEGRRRDARFCSDLHRAAFARRAEAEQRATTGEPSNRVRSDVERRLADLGATGHHLAGAVLALADRLDAGRDPVTGIASACRQLEATLANIAGEVEDRSFDLVDLLQLRNAVRRIDPDAARALESILTVEVVTRLNAQSTRTYLPLELPPDRPYAGPDDDSGWLEDVPTIADRPGRNW